MFRRRFLFILSIVRLCYFVYASDMDYIPDNWVDPTDMRNYDRYHKKMKSHSSIEERKTITAAVNGENNTDHLENLKRCEIFLERFINHMLSTANLKNKVMEPKTRIASEIPVLITSEELLRLKKLGEKITAANLHELDELFSSVLTNDRGFSFDSLNPYLNPIELLFFNLSYEKITVIVFIMVFCVVMWMFAVGKELKKIIIFLYLIFFMGGFGWNWWKMYQEAVIEQYAEMQTLSQIPENCIPNKSVGFFQYIFSTSSAKEDCRKYHTAFQFNPFSKVPPTIVLSETISGMLVYPLKAIGSSVGEFITGINNAAWGPFKIFFLPFVYITVVATFLCIVIVCLGIKVNFWTLLGGISIGGRIQNEAASHPTVTDEISLRRTIEYESETHYIITQVGTIRRCLTTALNEVPMISENTISSVSTTNPRLRISEFKKNLRSSGDECTLNDNSLWKSNNIKRHAQSPPTASYLFPTSTVFENENYSTSSINQLFSISPKAYFQSPKDDLNFASGDNKSQNSNDVAEDIQIQNKILRLFNCNSRRKVSNARSLNSRSVIQKKKHR